MWQDEFHGWDRFALLPYVLLLPPVFGVAGTAFDSWATHDERQTKKLHARASMLALLGGAAVAVSYVQYNMSYAQFELAPLRSWQVITVLGCSMLLFFFGGSWLAYEMAPRRMGEFDDDFDHNLLWEAKTAELVWRSWLLPGRHAAD